MNDGIHWSDTKNSPDTLRAEDIGKFIVVENNDGCEHTGILNGFQINCMPGNHGNTLEGSHVIIGRVTIDVNSHTLITLEIR